MTHSGISGDLPDVLSLPCMGALLGELEFTPSLVGPALRKMRLIQNLWSAPGDSIKDFKEGPNHGELLYSEALHGASEQNPLSSEASETPASWEECLSPCSPNSNNPDVLAEVGTLDLKSRKKNHSGMSKKRARKAKFAEAPARDSVHCQPQQGSPQVRPLPCSNQIQTLQKPSTPRSKFPVSEGPLQGPAKDQRLSGGTPEGEQVHTHWATELC